MSIEGNINLNSRREYIEAEEKKLKESNFLRQYNINFENYKKNINDKIFERDKEETERLNMIAQPQFVYNSFPLILGVIFILFGILMFFLRTDENIYYNFPVLDSKNSKTGKETVKPDIKKLKN
jgi:glutamate formiminotransferase